VRFGYAALTIEILVEVMTRLNPVVLHSIPFHEDTLEALQIAPDKVYVRAPQGASVSTGSSEARRRLLAATACKKRRTIRLSWDNKGIIPWRANHGQPATTYVYSTSAPPAGA
jgi:hypothetical protein